MISAVDADDIYRIPILLHEQHLDAIVCDKLGIEAPPTDLREWQQVVAGAPAARRAPSTSRWSASTCRSATPTSR